MLVVMGLVNAVLDYSFNAHGLCFQLHLPERGRSHMYLDLNLHAYT